MPVYKFQLIRQPGAEPFGHRNYPALAKAVSELLPLRSDLVLDETVGAEFVTMDVSDGVLNDDAKAQLDMAVAIADRADMWADGPSS